jgi:hypothetical protein
MGWVVSVMPRQRFTPGVRTSGTHCTGGWVGPRASLDTEVRGKLLCPYRGSNLDRQTVQPVVRHCTDWAILLTVRIYAQYIILEPLGTCNNRWSWIRTAINIEWCKYENYNSKDICVRQIYDGVLIFCILLHAATGGSSKEPLIWGMAVLRLE